MATHQQPAVEGRLISTSVADTREIGARLGRAAEPGTCLALEGPLGAGKTQLAKGVATGLDVAGVVNSPTFIIMNEHAGRLPLFHVDAYRLDDGDAARQAGVLDERQADGVTVIEWADRLDGWLPPERLRITLEADAGDPDRRVVHWQALGPRHAHLARVLDGEGGT
jgi:tRNA threonylcarbamoyladenosine biosynthesis protein TsaE